MSEVERFVTGRPGFTAQLNKLVDAYNELASVVDELLPQVAALAERVNALTPHAQPVSASAASRTPDESWSVKQIRAWARTNNVDLGAASSKQELLNVVAGVLGG